MRQIIISVYICIIIVIAIPTTIAENIFNNETTTAINDTISHGIDRLTGTFDIEMTELVNNLSDQTFILKGTDESNQLEKQPRARVRQHKNKKQGKKKTSGNNGGGSRFQNKRPKRPGGRPQLPQNMQRPPRPQRPNRPQQQNPMRPQRPQQQNPQRPQQTTPAQISNLPQNNQSRKGCFSISTYEEIEDDIANIKNTLRNPKEVTHFLGGIVRMAAHDFMDYDRRDRANPMGPDGCFDPNHASNAGLGSIWGTEGGKSTPLKKLYDTKYKDLGISRGDFWVASANAVIHLTSVNNALDLRDTFMWGRKDSNICRGSGDRLPQASGCDQVEDVFMNKMGLEMEDAVALLGAHTLGRGSSDFSGHEGTWVQNDKAAQTFDTGYFKSFFLKTWRPRVVDSTTGKQDWTTGSGHSQMMLNTDMCLVFDIEETVDRQIPCCTRTNTNECVDREAARRRCPMYRQFDRRREFSNTVRDMLGGNLYNNDNSDFYDAFARSWEKATTVGQSNLNHLVDEC